LGETHRIDSLTVLDRDIKNGEGQELEFKERFPEQARDLAESIASFATSNPGTIYIGVDDRGNIIGITEVSSINDAKAKDDYQLRIQGTTQNIDPPVRVKVEFLEKDSKIIARVDVPKGSEPVYYVEGRAFLRDLASSRRAKSSEVKELYQKHFALMRPVAKIDEITSYVAALTDIASDAELTLRSYKARLVNPDLTQMLYEIHVQAELLYGLSLVKPAEQLRIKEILPNISECLDGLAAHQFSIDVQSVIEFGKRASICLDRLSQLKAVLSPSMKIASLDTFADRLKHNLASLQNDWISRERRFKVGNVGILKEAFRSHAIAIHRLSARPEADKLDVKAELAELSLNLLELSSTEKYFGYWWRDEALHRLEQKYAESEILIASVMKKIS
jgi:hypothetical protein